MGYDAPVANAMRYILPGALLAYVLIVVVLRSWLHRRRTGASPIVLPGDDGTAYGYVGRVLVLLMVAIPLDVAMYEVSGDAYRLLAPIAWLEHDGVRSAALVLMALALPWIAVAQAQMGASFRIGIDDRHRTDLVATGLYRFSRNPIYLGMHVSLLALLCALPNALTLLLVGMAAVLIGVQVRLEEEHLSRHHGEAFAQYCQRVRRWL
jgi:protein-S-isoprenylcysteine O-methyltransferase Ste14